MNQNLYKYCTNNSFEPKSGHVNRLLLLTRKVEALQLSTLLIVLYHYTILRGLGRLRMGRMTQPVSGDVAVSLHVKNCATYKLSWV